MYHKSFVIFLGLVGHACGRYFPVREYAGPTFFDGWAYYGNVDNTTWGNVTFLDRPMALSKRLTYMNRDGNAIIKVDNASNIPAAPLVHRDSIRLTSLDRYGVGSLIVIDALHIPYGCSVWPSFWMLGTQQEWPNSGEIDIIESINNQDHNQIALHTTGGCFQAQIPGTQTGVTLERDCSTPRGCLVAETKPNSFGAGFAQVGGGAFALQFAESGIYAWFWSRRDIPDNVKTVTSFNSIDTASWGIPTAAYSAAACNISQYFPPQNLVLVTTLCGVWAGAPGVYDASCHTPTGSCVNDNIVGPGSTYDNAYWEIRYIRTYLSDDAPLPPASSSSTGPPTGSPTTPPTQTILKPPPSSRPSSAMSSRSWSYTVCSLSLLYMVAALCLL